MKANKASTVVKSILSGELFWGVAKRFKLSFIIIGIFSLGFTFQRFYALNLINENKKLEESIHGLKIESIEVKRELMILSKPSSIQSLLKEKGIEIDRSKEIPKVLHLNR